MREGTPARLELSGLTKRFTSDTTALHDLELSIDAGELLAVVGPSGSGKTTLLRLIAGLDDPTSGTVWIGDRSMTHVPPARRGVSLVFQQPALYPHLDVAENLGFGLKARGFRRRDRDRRVAELAELLRIEELLQRRPDALSGGEQRRVALGRALAVEPRVLLLDEPFSGLDAPLRRALRDEFQTLHRRLGMTTIIVTHDQAEALALGDRVAVLHSGRMLQCDTAHAVYDRPACRLAAAFIGSPPMNLVPLELERTPSCLRLRCHGVVVQMPIDTPWAMPLYDCPGGLLHLGVRPEHATLATDRAGSPAFLPLSGTLTRLEVQGHELLATVSVAATDVTLRLSPDRKLSIGQTLAVRLDLARASWFDAETGRRLSSEASLADSDPGRTSRLHLPTARKALVG